MPEPATSQDLEHLRLLSVFHYVLAGITALMFCFPLIHVALGIMMAAGAMEGNGHGSGGAPPRVFGVVFAIIGGAVVAAGWTLAGLMVAAGRCLARRRRHLFCVIVAGVSCMLMPFGTVLGVFTLVVLLRPQVKALFDAPSQPL
jgi:hypothetical protein